MTNLGTVNVEIDAPRWGEAIRRAAIAIAATGAAMETAVRQMNVFAASYAVMRDECDPRRRRRLQRTAGGKTATDPRRR